LFAEVGFDGGSVGGQFAGRDLIEKIGSLAFGTIGSFKRWSLPVTLRMPTHHACPTSDHESGGGLLGGREHDADQFEFRVPIRYRHPMSEIILKPAVPVLFVRDVSGSAGFFRERLGFAIDFVYGTPPFYGSVSRGKARFTFAASTSRTSQSLPRRKSP
jgi:hypothetical protein